LWSDDVNIYNYNFTSLDGLPMPMERFRNQPILLVNTASECGFTPQYAALQTLHNDYKQSGLVVIAMPCNDFGGQEPGSEAEIREFLDREYSVTFPVTAKYAAGGREMHPMFRDMIEEFGSDILPRWNFYKYLFNRKGDLVKHWDSRTLPDDPAIIHDIGKVLQSWSL
jgi:glutathione peroxidase